MGGQAAFPMYDHGVQRIAAPHTYRLEVAREDTGLVSRLPALGLAARAGRRTNVGLLALLLVAAATGVLAYGVGTPAAARAVTAVHGAAGLGLMLLVPWKSVIVRRALRRGLSVVPPKSWRVPYAAARLSAVVS
jgi:hypothetical protein